MRYVSVLCLSKKHFFQKSRIALTYDVVETLWLPSFVTNSYESLHPASYMEVEFEHSRPRGRNLYFVHFNHKIASSKALLFPSSLNVKCCTSETCGIFLFIFITFLCTAEMTPSFWCEQNKVQPRSLEYKKNEHRIPWVSTWKTTRLPTSSWFSPPPLPTIVRISASGTTLLTDSPALSICDLVTSRPPRPCWPARSRWTKKISCHPNSASSIKP